MMTLKGRALLPCAFAGILGALVLTGAAFCSEDAAASGAEGTGPAAVKHEDYCGACQAVDVWNRFVEHVRELGREDLLPADVASGEEKDKVKAQSKAAYDPASPDPVRGILFKLSPDLVNLDGLFEAAAGKTLEGADLKKAKALAEKLRAAEDPFVKAYGDLHAGRLEVEAGRHAEAVKILDSLVKSCYFFPKYQARRYLAEAYQGLGDDTLALLEYRFFLLDLPPGSTTETEWAEERIRAIRQKEHPGPLHDSEATMRLVSASLAGVDLGEGTQSRERRVEDIIDKVAKLLERTGGA